MPCSCLRRARGTDLAALIVALGGTFWAASIQAVLQPEPIVPGPVVISVAAPAEDPLVACARGFSSVESGGAHVGEPAAVLRPALLKQACELSRGADCDIENLIPRETALCVAEQVTLGEGRAHRASLGWHAAAETAVWTVTERPAELDAVDRCAERAVIVDAATGHVLGVRSEVSAGCR